MQVFFFLVGAGFTKGQSTAKLITVFFKVFLSSFIYPGQNTWISINASFHQ